MHENEIAKIVLDLAFKIHRELGPGLFESVYEEIMFLELSKCCELSIERQKIIPVIWSGQVLELGFRADIVVDHKVIVELKSVEKVSPVHAKQVVTYLRLSGCTLGLLINFNEELLKSGIRRLVNKLEY